MGTLIRYVLLTALRDRLFVALPLVLVLTFIISNVLSQTSMVEENAMHASFAAGAFRVILAIGMAVFVCFHVRAAFDAKEIDVMLSRPISRASLVLSYWVAFSIVSALSTLLAVVFLALTHPISWIAFALWVVSWIAELWIIVAIALFASITLRSAVISVIFTMCMMVTGRLMGYFLATVSGRMSFESLILNYASSYGIKGLAMFVPRLDMFAKSAWLTQGIINIQDVLLFTGQGLVFIPLLLSVAMIDFYRRQF